MQDLTVPMAQTLRKLLRADRRGDPRPVVNANTVAALEGRGLAKPYLASATLTEEGYRIARYLGEVPERLFPGDDYWFCGSCDSYVPGELVAWDEYDYTPDLGESIRCVNCLAKRRPAPVQPAHPVHHRAKLTPEQVRFIRKTDMRGSDLARKFGVSDAAISHVRTHRSWRGVR